MNSRWGLCSARFSGCGAEARQRCEVWLLNLAADHPPPAQPLGPSFAQLGVGRFSESLVSRTAASRASRCATVSQTRTATRLPGGASVRHVTFESAWEAFD